MLAPQVSVVGKMFVPGRFMVHMNRFVVNCRLSNVLVQVSVILFLVPLVPRVVVRNVGRF